MTTARRRAAQARLTVVQDAYVHGVSTRKVDDLVKALGLDGISTLEVSRICAEPVPVVGAFRIRPLTTECPDVWLDATYHKVRVDGRVVSQATVVAIRVTADGERQVLGIDIGASEDYGLYAQRLRGDSRADRDWLQAEREIGKQPPGANSSTRDQ